MTALTQTLIAQSNNTYMNSKSQGVTRNNSGSKTSLAKMMRRQQRKAKGPLHFTTEEPEVHQLEALDQDPGQLWFSVRNTSSLHITPDAFQDLCTNLITFFYSQKDEIKALRAQGQDILEKVNRAGGDVSTLDEANGESIRGLEHGLSVVDRRSQAMYLLASNATANGSGVPQQLNRSQRRKNIIHTILAQQQEQKDSGFDCAKGLQVTSKACTQWAKERAIEHGIQDFQQAIAIWREDDLCARYLPLILEKKQSFLPAPSTITIAGLSAASPLSYNSNANKTKAGDKKRTPEEARRQSQAALDAVSKSVASVLEELDDFDLDF